MNILSPKTKLAPELARPDKEKLWTRNFLCVFIINGFLFMSFHLLTPTFPYFIASLGGTDKAAGIAAAAISIAALIIRPYAGWVMDNKGRKLILMIGLTILIAVAFYYNTIQLVLPAIAFRFVQGLGFGIATTGVTTLASDSIPRGRFAEGISLYSVTGSVALAIAPALGLWIINVSDFHTLFTLSGAFAAGAFILAMVFSYDKTKVPKEKNPLVLKDLFSVDALRPAMVMLLGCMPFGAALSFVALYAGHRGIGYAGVYFIITAIAMTAVRIVTARIADRRGEGFFVLIGLGSGLLSLICLIFAHDHVPFLASAVFLGACFGLIMSSLQSLALRNSPPRRRGAASGTFLISVDLGTGIGGLIAGWVATASGYDMMFPVMLIPMIGSFIMYFIFLSSYRQKRARSSGN
jgi:MFS family permease